ncbi:hypothetical protein [Streptomyces sp. NPDC048111]|uniref:hypothetical protein n=1 Tax=Streptomyces sp. NPDC048111 TaxID=3365500 RepID=UPI0037204A95
MGEALQWDVESTSVNELSERLDEKATVLSEMMDRNQAQIVQLLAALVGKSPEES